MNFIYNDGGSGTHKKRDCVARAIAIATSRPYDEVYQALCQVNFKSRSNLRCTGSARADRGVDTRCKGFKDYLKSLGWTWTPTIGIGTGCRVHLRAQELPAGRLIVSVSRHYVAVIDGVIHDTFDPSRGGTRCVYGYWQPSTQP
jgi:hypothetical protein